MPVRMKTIDENAEKQVMLMAGHQRLYDVMRVFFENEYAENAAYLVVCEANGRVGVMSFVELLEKYDEVGPKLADMPLAQWPIPQATRVWAKDEVESGRDVFEWVKSHPGSRAVVLDKQGNFICLFANPNLSETRMLGSSLPRLHGDFTSLYADLRRLHPSLVKRVICPHCTQRTLYAITDQELICKNPECGGKIS